MNKNLKKPELLSPAGNLRKLKIALEYGADAVYLAGTLFGMRSAADNFTEEQLEEAIRYAHDRGVKVYVTVNTMPRDSEYPRLCQNTGQQCACRSRSHRMCFGQPDM